MTSLSLLSVIVDEFLDVGLDEAHLGEDLVGGGGPDERFGARVPVCDVVAYLLDQNFDTTEGTPADRLAGDDAKLDFDLVEPGRAHRREMKVDVRILLQPGVHLRGGVRGQVVQHHMNVSTDMPFDGFSERPALPACCG